MAKRSAEESLEKVIALLEEQLAYSNEQNEKLSRQVETLTQQVQYLTKQLFGSKTEKSKYQVPDGQGSLFDEDENPFPDSEQTEEQSQQMISYTVVRKRPKKRNDLFDEGIPTEVIHHHPEQLECCNRAH
ncbi:hypothetical protein [Sporosarcina sp. P37]|uniref:IS66 family transposase n=1 Tax=Sporosarcina sp. P37 TaxID=1930546 RepID=UPI0012F4B93E|nr:hypothetical protein [Sporosarcina sp. P37]